MARFKVTARKEKATAPKYRISARKAHPAVPAVPAVPDLAATFAEFPWMAVQNSGQKIREVPRPELAGEGTFPLTGISPVWEYRIIDPNNPQRVLELDQDQLGAVNLVLSGASCCIIGAAGTGKSTILQAINEILYPFHTTPTSYRIVRSSGQRAEGPPIALISFTNKAVRVIHSKVQVSALLKEAGFNYNITTAHNLLEFTRVQDWNEEKQKEVMRFVEQRGFGSPLNVQILEIDEASMIGVGTEGADQIGNKLHNALQEGTQEILMGDINQLPPVGGKSILSYGLSQLPIAELTKIHRQAMDSPIIAQAWNVLQGKKVEDQVNMESGSYVRIIAPKKKGASAATKLSAGTFNHSIENNFPKFIDNELFVPGRDIILSPVNKLHSADGKPYVSTTHINAVIGTYIAQKAGREVHEIIAGFNKVYLSVGDRVMVDKIEGEVTGITQNARYMGKVPREASTELTYFGWKGRLGANRAIIKEEEEGEDSEAAEYDYTDLADLDLDALPEHTEDSDKEEGRQASHLVNVTLDTDASITLSSSGEFAPGAFSLGYAISVHKAQGSEWQNVFLILHDGLPMMLSRELLYTACTRPKEKLIIIAQEHTLRKAISSPRIKGHSIASKIAFFNDGNYLNAGADFSFKTLRHLPTIGEYNDIAN